MTLTRPPGYSATPADTQLHVLPGYTLDETDNNPGVQERIREGSIEVLKSFPMIERTWLQNPTSSAPGTAKGAAMGTGTDMGATMDTGTNMGTATGTAKRRGRKSNMSHKTGTRMRGKSAHYQYGSQLQEVVAGISEEGVSENYSETLAITPQPTHFDTLTDNATHRSLETATESRLDECYDGGSTNISEVSPKPLCFDTLADHLAQSSLNPVAALEVGVEECDKGFSKNCSETSPPPEYFDSLSDHLAHASLNLDAEFLRNEGVSKNCSEISPEPVESETMEDPLAHSSIVMEAELEVEEGFLKNFTEISPQPVELEILAHTLAHSSIIMEAELEVEEGFLKNFTEISSQPVEFETLVDHLAQSDVIMGTELGLDEGVLTNFTEISSQPAELEILADTLSQSSFIMEAELEVDEGVLKNFTEISSQPAELEIHADTLSQSSFIMEAELGVDKGLFKNFSEISLQPVELETLAIPLGQSSFIMEAELRVDEGVSKNFSEMQPVEFETLAVPLSESSFIMEAELGVDDGVLKNFSEISSQPVEFETIHLLDTSLDLKVDEIDDGFVEGSSPFKDPSNLEGSPFSNCSPALEHVRFGETYTADKSESHETTTIGEEVLEQVLISSTRLNSSQDLEKPEKVMIGNMALAQGPDHKKRKRAYRKRGSPKAEASISNIVIAAHSTNDAQSTHLDTLQDREKQEVKNRSMVFAPQSLNQKTCKRAYRKRVSIKQHKAETHISNNNDIARHSLMDPTMLGSLHTNTLAGDVSNQDDSVPEEAVEVSLQDNKDFEPKRKRLRHTDNLSNFKDIEVGGVALALTHGSVLFEVAKFERHASTALTNPSRHNPSRLSIVFYQHKYLNRGNHGVHEVAFRKVQREFGQSPATLTTPTVTHSLMRLQPVCI